MENIRAVLFDVDGVLTDGTLWVDANGEVIKGFNVKDGVAVALLQKHGILVGVVSGKASAALDFRIQQLQFDVAITGCSDKLSATKHWLKQQGLSMALTAFVGDDIIDIPTMSEVGCAYAPADAHTLALATADFVTQAKGGQGVAREVAEHILLQQGISLSTMYADLSTLKQ